MSPRDPIAAVTHPDPYPYYADLAVNTPLYRDEALGLWIAASAAVTAVLASEHCAVRPPAELVPSALLASRAADIFLHLARMNDGQAHCPLKQAIAAALATLDRTEAADHSRAWTRVLFGETGQDDPVRLSDLAFQLPVYVIGQLLGISLDHLPRTALWIADFVTCLTPGADADRIARGKDAAGCLLDLFRALATDSHAPGLLAALTHQARRVGITDTGVPTGCPDCWDGSPQSRGLQRQLAGASSWPATARLHVGRTVGMDSMFHVGLLHTYP